MLWKGFETKCHQRRAQYINRARNGRRLLTGGSLGDGLELPLCRRVMEFWIFCLNLETNWSKPVVFGSVSDQWSPAGYKTLSTLNMSHPLRNSKTIVKMSRSSWTVHQAITVLWNLIGVLIITYDKCSVFWVLFFQAFLNCCCHNTIFQHLKTWHWNTQLIKTTQSIAVLWFKIRVS